MHEITDKIEAANWQEISDEMNFRPIKGTRGYYRATMKQGVSELHSGRRYTMGIIFHDAVS